MNKQEKLLLTAKEWNEAIEAGIIGTEETQIEKGLINAFREISTDLKERKPRKKSDKQTRINNVGSYELEDGRTIFVTVMISTDAERIKQI